MPNTLPMDLRYALRRLARSPGFTAAAVLMLAVGIGATTSMFSVVNGILLRPLPFGDPDRLLRVYQASVEHGVDQGAVSLVDFEDWREQNTVFSTLAAFDAVGVTGNLTGHGEPAALRTVYVSEDFFDTFGTSPRLGRVLSQEEAAVGLPAVVLSGGLWRRQFGGDPSIVGSSVNLDGEAYTVVGVMPAEFDFPTGADLWLPISRVTEDMVPYERGTRWVAVIGRLAPNASFEQARSEMSAITARLADEYPASNEGWDRATVIELRDSIVGDVGPALFVALSAVAFVLLMVCANLANLLLARASLVGGNWLYGRRWAQAASGSAGNSL